MMKTYYVCVSRRRKKTTWWYSAVFSFPSLSKSYSWIVSCEKIFVEMNLDFRKCFTLISFFVAFLFTSLISPIVRKPSLFLENNLTLSQCSLLFFYHSFRKHFHIIKELINPQNVSDHTESTVHERITCQLH